MTTTNSDYIYYNLSITNYGNRNTEMQHQQLKFLETRSLPIVNRAKDYKMSIVRFELSTYSLPVYIAQIVPNQSDINKMVHTITLVHTDLANNITVIDPVHLVWEAQDKAAALPPAPDATTAKFQSIQEYYYCYSYHHFIRIINQAFTTAMADLDLLLGGTIKTIQPPFMIWNNETKKAELYARKDKFNIDEKENIKVYFNRPLYTLFNSMPFYKNSLIDDYNRHYQIIIDAYTGSQISVPGKFVGIQDQLVGVFQELSTIANWSPVSSIVFTSSTLPIIPTQISNPIVYQDGQLIQLTNTSNQFSNIITDFSTNEDAYRSNLIYYPSGENRYISMASDLPITSVDIQVFWQDRLGILRPFYLLAGGSCTMKILFEKINK